MNEDTARPRDSLYEMANELLGQIISGDLHDVEEINSRKRELCAKYKLEKVPSNADILEHAAPHERDFLSLFLQTKRVRTLSGVAPVAIMTSPHDCPHGKCDYCPGGVANDSPQSYTGKEPAARRAIRNNYDPYDQTQDRIDQLHAIGHPTDKIDLIIMGGTFTSRDIDYQKNFVKRSLDAMNHEDSENLESSIEKNGTASSRCIGLAIETRPDQFNSGQAKAALDYGTTRIEFGVQALDDKLLDGINRGHNVQATVDSTRLARDIGLKVCYHIMPGLPGSTPEHDLEMFGQLFSDKRFMPDMLKIYPCLVMEGTPLYGKYQKGEYKPYDTKTATKLIADMKATVPDYVRIQRIERDIPVNLITAGVDKSHIRMLAREHLSQTGRRCRCIRCRESGLAGDDVTGDTGAPVPLRTIEYETAGGREYFTQAIANPENDLISGYLRLRLTANKHPIAAITKQIGDMPVAIIRELKVVGPMVELSKTRDDAAQHHGIGEMLTDEAECAAKKEGYKKIIVTSGVGVRGYYRKLGYKLIGPYMVKEL